MRKLVPSLLLVLALSTSVMAANFTIDGVRERGGYIIIEDATGAGDIGTACRGDMVRWGIAVDRSVGSSTHGTLYGFIEILEDVSYFAGPGVTNEIFPGFYIDTDLDTSTDSCAPHGEAFIYWIDTSAPDTTGDLRHMGVNTEIEWGINTYHWGEGYNFWGEGSPVNVGTQSTSIDGLDVNGNPLTGAISSVAYTGKVMEFAVDLSEVNDEHFDTWGTYPGATWVIGARCAFWTGGSSWAGDLSVGTVDRAPGTDPGGTYGKAKGILVGPGATAGEYNYDGTVDDKDIDLMTRCIYEGIDNALLDLDSDNDCDSADLAVLVGTILSTYEGDAGLDGKVNDLDFGTLSFYWQDSITLGDNPGWANADFNGDGVVNDLDFGKISFNWQAGVPTPGVPEPATLTLLALGGVALLRRRK